MDEVNSYVVVRTDGNGQSVMKLMEDGNPVQIPSTAERLTDEYVFQPNTIISIFHRPDCAWFTKD